MATATAIGILDAMSPIEFSTLSIFGSVVQTGKMTCDQYNFQNYGIFSDARSMRSLTRVHFMFMS